MFGLFKRPVNEINETHLCPLRTTATPVNDGWYLRGRHNCCTNCGSIHPDDLMLELREHGVDIVKVTDIPHQWALDIPGKAGEDKARVFYKQHATEDFKKEWQEMIREAWSNRTK